MLPRRSFLRLGAVGIGGVLAYGIWREYRPDPLRGRAEHRLGFSVGVPQGFAVRRKAGTLTIVDQASSKASRMVEVHAVAGRALSGPSPCAVAPRKTRHGPVCYLATKKVGANGLQCHTMTTGIRFKSVLIIFEAEHQTTGDPDFEFVWEMMDSLR